MGFLRGREVAVGAIAESWGGEPEDGLRYGTFRVGGIERLSGVGVSKERYKKVITAPNITGVCGLVS